MRIERGETRPTILEQNIGNLVKTLRRITGEEKSAEFLRYRTAVGWFSDKERNQNLTGMTSDFAYLANIQEYEIRSLLTYPVIGNWIADRLEQLDRFIFKNNIQKKEFALLHELVLEKRFNNEKTGKFYEGGKVYNEKQEELDRLLREHPEDAVFFDRFFNGIQQEAQRMLPGIDPHRIIKPIYHFRDLVSDVVLDKEFGELEPVHVPIIIIDDDEAKYWHKRMTDAGFTNPQNLPGFYKDGESALEAIKKSVDEGSFDPNTVILSDLDLDPGKSGKMSGIEFVNAVYTLLTKQGNPINPMISVFSYNDESLEKAEQELDSGTSHKVFKQVDLHNKASYLFTPSKFNRYVKQELIRRAEIEKEKQEEAAQPVAVEDSIH